MHREWMLLSASNLGNTRTRKVQQKRAHVRSAAEVLHDKSEHENICERLTHGQANTNVEARGEQNQP